MDKQAEADHELGSANKEAYGKLTVFLGAMPGVGKTYAMLEAAKERLAEGLDIVVGFVETHQCAETERMLYGLPLVARRFVAYNGKVSPEMDLEEILERRPHIALVDELAHTNAPGSRHLKRYQDVEELLASGINVYTTMNIQHVESFNDIVAQITNVNVGETVPDRILESAYQIQLVDIPPEELIQRLNDGKVFVPDEAAEMMKKFFRPGNINALREITMRFTAQRVDRQLESYMRVHGIPGPWPTAEKVLVCIGASPFSGKLIRHAKRMATRLKAEFIAVHVEPFTHQPRNEADQDMLERNFQLAEKLGAEIVSLSGNDAAKEILDLARKRNISQIIIGRPEQTRLREWLQGSLVNKVIRNSHGISVHIISGQRSREKLNRIKSKKQPIQRPSANALFLVPYLWVILIIAAISLLVQPIANYLGKINISLLFILAVLLSAALWGRKPALFASLLAMVTLDFLFIPPLFSFSVFDIRYLISFIIFMLVGIVTGTLSARLTSQIIYSRQRETKVAALYSLSRDIAAVDKMETILESIARKVSESLEGEVVLFLPDAGGKLVLRQSSSTKPELNNSELAAAVWVFERGQKAGRGTETLPTASRLYLPLSIEQGTLGVLGIQFAQSEELDNPERLRLLEAFSGLAAMAINRINLTQEARQAHALRESERLRTALFNSLSHDLRTPLASVIGAATGLLEDNNQIYSPAARHVLLQTILQGAQRMNRFVSNLLDMARLESGMLKLNKDWCDIQDIIGVAVNRLGDVVTCRPLDIEVSEDLPFVQADYVLIEQVLINLLDNAQKYSEPNSKIYLSARQNGSNLEVSVVNRGHGIPEADLSKVFDKFYRLSSPLQVSGTGLGLAICKGIIEVHGGQIWAENNEMAGVTITFTLPLEEGKTYFEEGDH